MRRADHAEPVEAARVLAILDEIRQEVGGGRWKGVAARRLGIHRSMVLRLVDGTRPVTRALVARIDEVLRRTEVPEKQYILVANLTRSYDMQRLLGEVLASDDVPEEERREVGTRIAGWIERMQTRMGLSDR